MFFRMLAYRRDARSIQPARKVRQTPFFIEAITPAEITPKKFGVFPALLVTIPGSAVAVSAWPAPPKSRLAIGGRTFSLRSP
jgi:hypothetical protein